MAGSNPLGKNVKRPPVSEKSPSKVIFLKFSLDKPHSFVCSACEHFSREAGRFDDRTTIHTLITEFKNHVARCHEELTNK